MLKPEHPFAGNRGAHVESSGYRREAGCRDACAPWLAANVREVDTGLRARLAARVLREAARRRQCKDNFRDFTMELACRLVGISTLLSLR